MERSVCPLVQKLILLLPKKTNSIPTSVLRTRESREICASSSSDQFYASSQSGWSRISKEIQDVDDFSTV